MKIVNNKKEIISEAYPQHTSDSLLIVVSRELDKSSYLIVLQILYYVTWSVHYFTAGCKESQGLASMKLLP